MLRVIAGKYRGRLLSQPPLEITRATKDRVREAVFNSIQFEVASAVVLDLFAGSGAFAIEFLSRGAAKAIAIDHSDEAFKAMSENKEALKLNNLSLIKASLPEALSRLTNTRYDFIVIDAPYEKVDLTRECLAQIANLQLLKPLGFIIVEVSSTATFSLPPLLAVRRTSIYGNTKVLVLANIL